LEVEFCNLPNGLGSYIVVTTTYRSRCHRNCIFDDSPLQDFETQSLCKFLYGIQCPFTHYLFYRACCSGTSSNLQTFTEDINRSHAQRISENHENVFGVFWIQL